MEIDCAGFDDAGGKRGREKTYGMVCTEDMDMADIGFNFQYAAPAELRRDMAGSSVS